MKPIATIAGVFWLTLAVATPEALAQARGGVMPSRVPPPKPERVARQQHPLDRWASMPPKQREAALSRLPPARAENVRARLAKWESLTPEQKQRAREFAAKPADQKQIIRDHAQWFQQLAQDRRPAIRREINSLQSLSPEARQAELESPLFAKRFNEDEREHIGKFVSTMEE